MTSISLCMIVRDEAARLERCIASVRGVVDEIVVVDTGSRDDTVRIAERAGARVAHETWREDFSEARNASLALARSDWALVLDADERLSLSTSSPQAARAALETFAARQPRSLGRVLVRNFDGASELSRVAIARFLPLHAGAQFHGRIHEQVRLRNGEAPARVDTGLVIEHEGYSQEALRERGKLQRNIALLERWTREAPDDSYAWYQLGRTRSVGQDHEGALGDLQRALELSRDDEPWPVHAVEIAARSLQALGRVPQALELVEQACELAPERADTLFVRAGLLLELGEVAAARAGFRACLETPARSAATESWLGASSYAAAHNLGVISECSGQFAQARAWYERALEFAPEHEPSRERLAQLPRSAAGLPSAGSIG